MDKMGQIPLFVILGLMVFAVVLLLIYTIPETKYTPPILVKDEIQSATEKCLKESLVESLFLFGQQGRIYAEKNVYSVDGPVAIFVENDKSYMPSMIDVEQDLKKHMVRNFERCLTILDELPGNIENDDLQFSFTFSEGSIMVKANMLLVYTLDNRQTTLSDFSAKVDFSFKELYSAVEDAVRIFLDSPNLIDISGLSELPGKVTLTQLGEYIVVTLEDNALLLEEEPYPYNFAVLFGDGK